MTIAGLNEPGEKLIITGTIFKADSVTTFPDVILYAYHTDHTGHYSKKGDETGVQKWHGHLHGWCKTGSNGQYEIRSIRPARYPGNAIPAHIHAAFKTPDGQMNYINEFVFKDDSLVNEKYLSSLSDAGGTGVVDLKKTAQNTWTGKRDLIIK
jgi:protocatechuate 3,4-dioxygenase beta subunit